MCWLQNANHSCKPNTFWDAESMASECESRCERGPGEAVRGRRAGVSECGAGASVIGCEVRISTQSYRYNCVPGSIVHVWPLRALAYQNTSLTYFTCTIAHPTYPTCPLLAVSALVDTASGTEMTFFYHASEWDM